LAPYKWETVKDRIFQNQDGGGRHLVNHKNRDISTTAKPILTKLATVMQNGSLNSSDR